jgi:hypothetical protein
MKVDWAYHRTPVSKFPSPIAQLQLHSHGSRMAPFSFGTHALEILNDDVWCDQDFDDYDDSNDDDDQADDDCDDFEPLFLNYVSSTLPLSNVAPSHWMANVLEQQRQRRPFDILEHCFMGQGIRPRRT